MFSGSTFWGFPEYCPNPGDLLGLEVVTCLGILPFHWNSAASAFGNSSFLKELSWISEVLYIVERVSCFRFGVFRGGRLSVDRLNFLDSWSLLSERHIFRKNPYQFLLTLSIPINSKGFFF